MKKAEKFPDTLKREIVLEVLSGRLSKEEARRVYGIKSKSGVLEWMRTFAGISSQAHGVDPIPKLKDMKKDPKEVERLKTKIKELEQELEYLELKGRAYQIMVEIARKEYGLDLEKKLGTKQSDNSKKNIQKPR